MLSVSNTLESLKSLCKIIVPFKDSNFTASIGTTQLDESSSNCVYIKKDDIFIVAVNLETDDSAEKYCKTVLETGELMLKFPSLFLPTHSNGRKEYLFTEYFVCGDFVAIELSSKSGFRHNENILVIFNHLTEEIQLTNLPSKIYTIDSEGTIYVCKGVCGNIFIKKFGDSKGYIKLCDYPPIDITENDIYKGLFIDSIPRLDVIQGDLKLCIYYYKGSISIPRIYNLDGSPSSFNFPRIFHGETKWNYRKTRREKVYLCSDDSCYFISPEGILMGGTIDDSFPLETKESDHIFNDDNNVLIDSVHKNDSHLFICVNVINKETENVTYYTLSYSGRRVKNARK